ncbi:nitroreductase [Thermoproteus uzoniensis 768-20]|uniref:Nitroreductase n=1 Tax=Thermoproteus uzoniensis (strain 768-20) TaxID=999630 RepID=F2L0S5_THEU7|nr:SagB/ThcOx family dehydrogenase [Thermoproteus uzoniensis]AEA12740.1 nitroreductase [Thermoproteus uzoniensis 768-20]
MNRRNILMLVLLSPLYRLIASLVVAAGALGALSLTAAGVRKGGGAGKAAVGEIFLPIPSLSGAMSVEEALSRRRSVRKYLKSPITLSELSQILWAAYGISETKWGLRTAPSAGAIYPLNVYVVVGEGGVLGDGGALGAGVYRYLPHRHSIILLKGGDVRRGLYEAALRQIWVLEAPVSLVVTAQYEKTARVYGERGRVRYVHMDLGHLGQNVYLQATALGLGTVAVGAFDDDGVREVLGLPDGETPLYIMPVGRVARLYRISREELAEYYSRNRSIPLAP